MPTDEYATYVVSETLKPNSRVWIWSGAQSLYVWFLVRVDFPPAMFWRIDVFCRRSYPQVSWLVDPRSSIFVPTI